MNSTTKAWIAAGVGILFSVGLIVWQVRASHAAAVNLTADDMTQIAQDQNAQARQRLAADDKARKDFAKNVRELLSVAEEARSSTAPVKFQNPDGTWVVEPGQTLIVLGKAEDVTRARQVAQVASA